MSKESLNSKVDSNFYSNYKNQLMSLPYHIKAGITSEDPSFPLSNLEEKEFNNNGWISQKFPIFPQKIIIKFNNYIDLRQINILINETKIPSIIQFINCIPLTENKRKNEYKYETIGHIELSTNEDSNFNSREFRKIILDIKKVKRIKILLFKNFQNSFNVYNQVGIVSLKFIGCFSEMNNNNIKNINEDNILIAENKEDIKEENKNYEQNEVIEEINQSNKLENDKELKENKFYENYNSEENKNNEINKNKEEQKENVEEKEEIHIVKNIGVDKTNWLQSKNINDFKEEQKNEIIYSDDMIEIIKEKIQELNEELNKGRINKEYNECNNIKNDIESLEMLLKKIKSMKANKQSIQNNDLIYKRNKTIKINEFKYKSINNDKEKTNKNSQLLKIKTMNVNRKKSANINLLSPLSNKNSSYNITPIKNKIIKIQNIKFTSPKKLYKSRLFQYDSFIPHGLSYDNLVHLEIRQNSKNNSLNEKEDNNNSLNEEKKNVEMKPLLEELPQEVKMNNQFLINIVGEEVIKKIYSNNIYYKEQGFDILNMRVNDIITFSPEDIQETNKYIFSFINIFIEFIDDNNPSIALKCLDLFMNIIKAIKEKKVLNKIEYKFPIIKPIIYKIKRKLCAQSKIIRDKSIELYYNLLNSNLCDYNSLIIELIENEVNEYFYKLNILNHNDFGSRVNSNRVGIGISKGIVHFNYINKNLIISIMNIFLNIFNDYEKYANKKKDINKFPKNLVGDYIIMNLKHPNKEIVEIAKKVLIKFINIFGNQIFFKLELIIGKKDLTNIFQTNPELMIHFRKYSSEKSHNNNETNLNMNQKQNKFPQISSLVLGMNNNFNKSIFYNPKNHKYRIKIKKNSNNFNEIKSLIKNSSQSKLFLSNK